MEGRRWDVGAVTIAALRFLLSIFAVAVGLACSPGEARAGAAVPLSAAVEARTLSVEAKGNGRDQLTVSLKNATAAPVTVAIPAGVVATGAKGESRVIVLREATATVPAGGAMEVSLPVVALSSKNEAVEQVFVLQTGTEARLAGLIKALADQPDAPRATVQLTVLALLEDMNFSQWRQFLGAATTAQQPTPAEVTQAVDALGLLRQAAPQGTFALASDTELKLRALRNPWSRGKAMALYGLDAGVEAAAPDLRQLLHTQAGDNCPVCRQRALMQKPGDIP